VLQNKRIENLRSVYLELDEDRKEKMEMIAVGLLDVQMIVEKERFMTLFVEENQQEADSKNGLNKG